LNELGNEELLSANKDESGCNGCEATARLSNQETGMMDQESRSQTRLERIND
jgi:hypothetical protein